MNERTDWTRARCAAHARDAVAAAEHDGRPSREARYLVDLADRMGEQADRLRRRALDLIYRHLERKR